MAYKKPQLVAKSAPKQSYVAGCPTKTQHTATCGWINTTCQVGPIK